MSWVVRALLAFENVLIERLLASPRFHGVVRRIHRTVEDARYGRDPNEPLRPGEASEDPNLNKSSFLDYFIEELRSQFRGGPPKGPPPVDGPKP